MRENEQNQQTTGRPAQGERILISKHQGAAIDPLC